MDKRSHGEPHERSPGNRTWVLVDFLLTASSYPRMPLATLNLLIYSTWVLDTIVHKCSNLFRTFPATHENHFFPVVNSMWVLAHVSNERSPLFGEFPILLSTSFLYKYSTPFEPQPSFCPLIPRETLLVWFLSMCDVVSILGE